MLPLLPAGTEKALYTPTEHARGREQKIFPGTLRGDAFRFSTVAWPAHFPEQTRQEVNRHHSGFPRGHFERNDNHQDRMKSHFVPGNVVAVEAEVLREPEKVLGERRKFDLEFRDVRPEVSNVHFVSAKVYSVRAKTHSELPNAHLVTENRHYVIRNSHLGKASGHFVN